MFVNLAQSLCMYMECGNPRSTTSDSTRYDMASYITCTRSLCLWTSRSELQATWVCSECLCRWPMDRTDIKGCMCKGLCSSKYIAISSTYIMCTWMWCNLGKSVWSRTCDIFIFPFDWSVQLERYILLQNPPELDQWFQSYEQLKDSRNNRILQKKFIPFSRVSNNQCSWLLTDSARLQHTPHHLFICLAK